MPSSFLSSVIPIMGLVIEEAPESILDIGPGHGKYGLLCREYLPQLERLDAVEVPEGRQPTQAAIYDNVYYADVRTLAANGTLEYLGPWQMVLLIDVIEHMSHADGHALLGVLMRSGAKVLVSTPQVFMDQHDDRNPFEEHVSLWGWDQLRHYRIESDVSTPDSVIYLLSRR